MFSPKNKAKWGVKTDMSPMKIPSKLVRYVLFKLFYIKQTYIDNDLWFRSTTGYGLVQFNGVKPRVCV